MLCRLHLRKYLLIAALLFLLSIFIIWTWLPSTSREDNSSSFSYTLSLNSDSLCANEGQRLAVVVPYRERSTELFQFVPHMNTFLNKQNVCHQFYVINQVDKYRFNRGMLINVGFILSSNQSTYMAMHDVDLLPINLQLSYRFPSKSPFHISAPNLHPKYHYEKFVGGILLLQNQQFVQVNGFSTNYWGWGLEGL